MNGLIRRNILITGPPRVGKSTLIEKVVSGLGRPVTGFYTKEMKEKGKRVGFTIVTLDGNTGVLAHRDIKGSPRVGKYGVDVDKIDSIAVSSMIPSRPDEIVMIDEIGKMECLSPLFCKTLLKVLDSDNPVIASIALKGTPFIEDIKTRHDIILMELTEKNRIELQEKISVLLKTT